MMRVKINNFNFNFKLVDGLFTSKLRYGLQLLGKVRTSSEDPLGAEFKAIQLVQNNLLRTLSGTKIKDMVSIASMLDKFNMQSVNQTNAGIKLLEIWKAINIDDYPLFIKRQETDPKSATTRSATSGRPIEIGKTALTNKTSISDSIRLWNRAPTKVKECKTLYQVKKEIKSYVKLLPI